MRIAITGAFGFIGGALVSALEGAGHTVIRLVRGQPQPGEVRWNPGGALDPATLEGVEAVVNLAGESVSGRWSAAKKERIRESRVQGTRTLAEAVARMSRPPGVMVAASAVGYYGNRGDELLTEDSVPGNDFLAKVCIEREQAAEPAGQAGVRVVNLRIGFVLSAEGGGLAQMLPPFRLGLGGRLGGGRQWMSWISREDVLGAIQHALTTESLRGPVNTAAPNPVTNAEFTRILGEVLHRPTIFPVPAFMVKLLFGEMGEALLLSSQRVDSSRLAASYQFRHPELRPALAKLLGR